MAVTKAVLIAGRSLQAFDRAKLFEGAQGIVKGLVGCKGTADNQLKILGASPAVPFCIFDIQRSHIPMISGKPNSDYAVPGEAIDYIRIQPGVIVRLVLKAGETVVTDADAFAEYSSGKIVAAAGAGVAVKIGKVEVGLVAGGTDNEVLVRLGVI